MIDFGMSLVEAVIVPVADELLRPGVLTKVAYSGR